MNTRNNLTKLSIAIGVLMLFATGILWGLRRAQAGNEHQRAGRFSTLNVARGQSLRLSVANITPPDVPPDPLRVRLGFMDADGNLLTDPRSGEPVRKTMTLENGQSTSLTLNGDDFVIGDAIATGIQVRPFVVSQFQGDADGKAPPDPLAPLVEVIDNITAKTSFVYPGSERMGWQNHNETLVRDRSGK